MKSHSRPQKPRTRKAAPRSRVLPTATLADRMTGLGKGTPEVVGLYMLPRGPAVPLGGFIQDGEPKRLITIGTHARSDIVLADRAVSRDHCLLECDDDHVLVHDSVSKNGTYINGTHVQVGRLHPGYVLTVGQQSLVAYGPGGYNRYSLIVAASLNTFIHKAARLHGSMRAAALAVGMAPSTFVRWLKRRAIPNRNRAHDATTQKRLQ